VRSAAFGSGKNNASDRAKTAMADLNGSMFRGRRLVVEPAKEKPRVETPW
jgi:hypothetical protein